MKDDPKDWTDRYHPPPSNFDVGAYQRKIDAITGLAGGHSVIKVFWGASEEESVAEQFTSHGTATAMKRVGRHRTRVKGIAGKVRIRRWIFCEWQPPEQVEQNAFIRLPEANGLYLPPSMVAERRVGRWISWYPACDHSNCLPDDCNSTEYFCFGDYREPSQADLNKIKRITAKQAGSKFNPLAPISQTQIDQWFKEADDEIEAIEQKEREEMAYEYKATARLFSRTSVSGK